MSKEMSRPKDRPEFNEDNERIIKEWKRRGMRDEDIDAVVREFGSPEFIEYWDTDLESDM